MSDGTLVRTYALPPVVSIRGGTATLTRDHRALYVSALWEPARGFSRTYPQNALFKGAKLGLRLSLDDGKTESMVDPVDLGCRGYAEGCWNVPSPVAESGQNARWLVGQGCSERPVV